MNSTTGFIPNSDVYDIVDTFPFSYEDDHVDSSLTTTLNRSYYDDLISSHLNEVLNSNSTSTSIFSFSSPFTYLILIIISYFILTLILLTFSLYKQRQMEIDNFYFGDTDEEIEQNKRHFLWKQFLIGKIQKGDMEPLLLDRTDQSQQRTFPLYLV